jgi:hypothetical protein
MNYYSSVDNSDSEEQQNNTSNMPENNSDLENTNSITHEIKPDFPLEDLEERKIEQQKQNKKPPFPVSSTGEFIITETGPTTTINDTRVPTGATPVPKRHAPPYATQPFFYNQVSAGTRINSQPVVSNTTTSSVKPVDPLNQSQTIKPSSSKKTANRKGGGSKDSGCFIKAVIAVLILSIASVFILAIIAIYQYLSLSSTLPEINNLSEKTSQFETTRIMDRNGDLLYEMISPTAGRRTYVPLEKISPYLVAATIATEDKIITLIRVLTLLPFFGP